MIVEEQKMTQAVEAAMQMARKDLASDPDGVLEVLRGLYARVKDDPNLGEQCAQQPPQPASTPSCATRPARPASSSFTRKRQQAQSRRSSRTWNGRRSGKRSRNGCESQFRAFRSLMNEARFETAAMQEMLKGMVDIEREAKIKGNPVPLTAQADLQRSRRPRT